MANSQHLLQPGETMQTAFEARSISDDGWGQAFFILAKHALLVVVVTDRRNLICSTGRFGSRHADEILRELPRSTKIGPPVLPKALLGVQASGIGRIDSLDLWVPRFSFKEIDLADSMLT